MSFNTSSTYMLMRLVTVFILIAGAYYVMRGELSYGEFAAFILISNVISPIELKKFRLDLKFIFKFKVGIYILVIDVYEFDSFLWLYLW